MCCFEVLQERLCNESVQRRKEVDWAARAITYTSNGTLFNGRGRNGNRRRDDGSDSGILHVGVVKCCTVDEEGLEDRCVNRDG